MTCKMCGANMRKNVFGNQECTRCHYEESPKSRVRRDAFGDEIDVNEEKARERGL